MKLMGRLGRFRHGRGRSVLPVEAILCGARGRFWPETGMKFSSCSAGEKLGNSRKQGKSSPKGLGMDRYRNSELVYRCGPARQLRCVSGVPPRCFGFGWSPPASDRQKLGATEGCSDRGVHSCVWGALVVGRNYR